MGFRQAVIAVGRRMIGCEAGLAPGAGGEGEPHARGIPWRFSLVAAQPI